MGRGFRAIIDRLRCLIVSRRVQITQPLSRGSTDHKKMGGTTAPLRLLGIGVGEDALTIACRTRALDLCSS